MSAVPITARRQTHNDKGERMMDIYKKKLKFRDFPTRYSGDLFYVEKEYDEKLNLFVINHLADIQDLFGKESIFFNYIPFLIPKNRNAILYHYPAMDSEQLNISATSDLLLSFLVDEKQCEKFCSSILELDHVKDTDDDYGISFHVLLQHREALLLCVVLASQGYQV